jgi:hypothetical protein
MRAIQATTRKIQKIEHRHVEWREKPNTTWVARTRRAMTPEQMR